MFLGLGLDEMGIEKIMSDKKGVAVGYLIAAIVAFFVLFVVLFGGLGGPSGLKSVSDRILNFFPTFGGGEVSVEGVNILRYDIAEDKVQYYDGERWVDFEKQGEIKLRNKKLNYVDVRGEYKNYWYGGERSAPKSLDLSTDEKIIIYPTKDYQTMVERRWLERAFANTVYNYHVPKLKVQILSIVGVPVDENSYSQSIDWFRVLLTVSNSEDASLIGALGSLIVKRSGNYLAFERGDVFVALVGQGTNNQIYGNFVLTGDNVLKINRLDKSKIVSTGEIVLNNKFESVDNNAEPYMKIRNSIVEWRDFVLKKPIEIKYVNVEDGSSMVGRYCLEKKDNRYLIAYLDEEIRGGTC